MNVTPTHPPTSRHKLSHLPTPIHTQSKTSCSPTLTHTQLHPDKERNTLCFYLMILIGSRAKYCIFIWINKFILINNETSLCFIRFKHYQSFIALYFQLCCGNYQIKFVLKLVFVDVVQWRWEKMFSSNRLIIKRNHQPNFGKMLINFTQEFCLA